MPWSAKTNEQKVKEAKKALGIKDDIRANRDKERSKGRVNLYNSTRWRKLRKAMLSNKPLCEECVRNKRVTASSEIDHIFYHGGDMVLFWKISNLQCLCTTCHSSDKQRLENKWRAMGLTYEEFLRDKDRYLAMLTERIR